MEQDQFVWWKHGVVYQIYPRSFQDSNGDGIGDLQGVLDRLDYLNDGTDRSLGIDAIWFSPTFPSPMKDFGYDVSDYIGVHPDFGDLVTMDRLIAACHERGIRVMLDFVPNHSSDQHPWFIESRSGRTNPKRDWYVWRDAKPDGSPPNNWLATFGGSSWEWDEATGQYYLHSFLKEQPDLNWRNLEVEQAMLDVLRFWMDRGIDGFRIDVVGMILKDPELRDNPTNPDPRVAEIYGQAWAQEHIYDRNFPDVFDKMRDIRRTTDEYPDRMAIGEAFGDAATLMRFMGGEALDGLHLAFNFQLIREGRTSEGNTAWDAVRIRRVVDQTEAALPQGAWTNYVWGNHDVSRFISRYNVDGRGRDRARIAAMLLLTLRGMPFIYYGEEIGMEDVPIPEDRAHDPARFAGPNRDPERTPMPWTAEPGRGFTSGEPWLPFGDPRINVADQQDNPASLLTLYRRLLWYRKGSDALRFGDYRPVEVEPDQVFAYLREADGDRLLVLLNFGIETADVTLPEGIAPSGPVVSTRPDCAAATIPNAPIRLAELEGLILTLA
ncbi:MAG: alpha-amylase family glycosyl hydrolase [Dehalococcoidia bacterium]